MVLSDGSIKTFAVPVDKFHELRYSVASVLRSFGQIESTPVMRIMTHTQAIRRQQQQQEEIAYSKK